MESDRRPKLDWARDAAKRRVVRESIDAAEQARLDEGPPCARCRHIALEHSATALPGLKAGCHHEIWFKRRWHDCPCPAYVLHSDAMERS